MENSNNNRVVIIILLVLAVAFGGSTYFFYQKYAAVKQDPQKYAQETANQIVEQVGKLILLPTGETPTIATVVDPAKLKDQPFFAHAKVGDKVLIYTNARKAILFDAVNNKIVEVAPLTIGNPVAPTPARTAPASANTETSTAQQQ